MDDGPRSLELTPNLKDAIRRVRLVDVDREAQAVTSAARELAALEELDLALTPVFAQIPNNADLFDHGIVPGDPARLHIDVLAFVEMARGQAEYRFMQDGRWGRRVVAESSDKTVLVQAITDYIALRLIEREKALASDRSVAVARPAAAPALVQTPEKPIAPPEAASQRQTPAAMPMQHPPRRFLPGSVWFFLGALFGAALLFGVALLRAATIGD